MTSADLKLAKWRRWLQAIKIQLYVAAESHHVFHEIFAMVRANPSLPRTSLVYGRLGLWYGDSVLMAVRRQAKSMPQSISLRRLLEEIRDNPAVLTRQYWVGLWAGHPLEARADRAFDKYSGQGSAYVDAGMVQKDIDDLQRQLQRCERYTDKRIAHFDKGQPPSTPTYRQLDDALKALEKTFQKYYNIVTADSIMTITPTIAYNWKRVFDVAWAASTIDN